MLSHPHYCSWLLLHFFNKHECNPPTTTTTSCLLLWSAADALTLARIKEGEGMSAEGRANMQDAMAKMQVRTVWIRGKATNDVGWGAEVLES